MFRSLSEPLDFEESYLLENDFTHLLNARLLIKLVNLKFYNSGVEFLKKLVVSYPIKERMGDTLIN